MRRRRRPMAVGAAWPRALMPPAPSGATISYGPRRMPLARGIGGTADYKGFGFDRAVAIEVLSARVANGSGTIARVKALTRDRILSALGLLAERLPAGEPRVELIVVGGAAMVLLFGARESTKDVDAFSLEPGVRSTVASAAAEVATALGLPDDWLNDGAKGYAHGLSLGAVLLVTPALRVRTLSVEQLLVMKLSAWRDDLDVEDARMLLRECGQVRDEVWREVEQYVVPGREMKARYAFDDLWESEHGSA